VFFATNCVFEFDHSLSFRRQIKELNETQLSFLSAFNDPVVDSRNTSSARTTDFNCLNSLADYVASIANVFCEEHPQLFFNPISRRAIAPVFQLLGIRREPELSPSAISLFHLKTQTDVLANAFG
jgi:hypothetical protein